MYFVKYMLIMTWIWKMASSSCVTWATTIGKKLQHKTFLRISPFGYQKCAIECSRKPDCLSFNFNRPGLTCELNSDKTDSNNPLITDQNYHYVDKSAIPSICPSACNGITCQSYGHTRIKLSSGVDICLSLLKDKPDECKNTMLGYEYSGYINVTKTGIGCQHWTSMSPHIHVFANQPVNYCRNPDLFPEGPWCYTINPNIRWQYCNVPFCI